MATINITTEGDLLILSVSGKLTARDFVDTVKEHYATGTVKDVIWNLSVGAMQQITIPDLKDIAKTVYESCKGGARSGGKTIFVAHDEAEYKLLCTYLAIIEATHVPLEYHDCRFMTDARDWLK